MTPLPAHITNRSHNHVQIRRASAFRQSRLRSLEESPQVPKCGRTESLRAAWVQMWVLRKRPNRAVPIGRGGKNKNGERGYEFERLQVNMPYTV
jgi:hypothetical protein